jgi:predicted proteasome-type protease
MLDQGMIFASDSRTNPGADGPATKRASSAATAGRKVRNRPEAVIRKASIFD